MEFAKLSRRRIGLIIFGLMLSVLVSALDSTIVGTAMPKVINDLQGMEHYAWPFTAYMLTSTISIPIFGKLADIMGRKPIYFIGVIVFLLGSALCGLSQTMLQLIFFRGLQGIGGGVMMSGSMQIVGEIFPPIERGKYMGLITSMFGLASIFGPALGGFITDNLNWRWIFYVNLPVGILAMIVMFYALPYSKLREKRVIDYPGVVALIIALVPLLLGLSWAGKDYAWWSAQIVGLLSFATVMLVVFVLLERKAVEPIIPLSLFKNSIFVTSIIAGFLTAALMFSAIMYIPLFVQGVMGFSATSSGIVTTPMMLSLVLTGIISGQIISRTGRYKALAILSFVVIIVGMWWLSRFGLGTTNAQVVAGMIILGVGIGITMPVFSISVQNAFPLRQIGVVTSGLQFFRNIGGTIGTAVFGSLMSSSMARGLANVDLSKMPPQLKGLLGNPQSLTNPDAINAIKSQIPPNMLPLFNSVMEQVRSVLASAIREVFVIGIFIAVLALITILFLQEIELQKGGESLARAKTAEE